MLMPSSQPRAEELLRDALNLGASDLFIKGKVEDGSATIRYKINGALAKTESTISGFEGLIDELKALVTEMVDEDEYEWCGHFPFSAPEQNVWVRVQWIRSQKGDVLIIRVLGRWLTFADLGLNAQDASILDELISFRQGIVVGCGSVGCGHATTLDALLERLAQNGKRVATLTNWPDPRLQGVTHVSTVNEAWEMHDAGWSEQALSLAGRFDVIALGNLNSNKRVHTAFDLARSGHLVLGLIYSYPLQAAMSRFAADGISPEELNAYFLGGWSQRLVRRVGQKRQIGLFACTPRKEVRSQILTLQDVDFDTPHQQEQQSLWRDAKEKIEAGLITREDAEQRLFPSA